MGSDVEHALLKDPPHRRHQHLVIIHREADGGDVRVWETAKLLFQARETVPEN